MPNAEVMSSSIVELFSQPRVGKMPDDMSGEGGSWAFDLRVTDKQGRRWDFDDTATQEALNLSAQASLAQSSGLQFAHRSDCFKTSIGNDALILQPGWKH